MLWGHCQKVAARKTLDQGPPGSSRASVCERCLVLLVSHPTGPLEQVAWEASDETGQYFSFPGSSSLCKWIKFWIKQGLLLSWHSGMALPLCLLGYMLDMRIIPPIQTWGS